MRKEKQKYTNDIVAANLSKELCKLTGIFPNQFRHVMWLVSIGLTHLVAIEARNSDSKLKDVHLEIPYVGLIVVEVTKDDIKFKELRLEEEFKDRLHRAVNKGESDLQKEINNKFVENIKKKYEEIV